MNSDHAGTLSHEADTTAVDRKALIRIEDLSIHYNAGTPAVQDLNLSVDDGEFVCIVGPSGCGKSTLMQVLSGLMAPSAGRVVIAGRTWDQRSGEGHRVGYVFQDHRLLPWRTVRQNLEIALKAAGTAKARWPEIIDRHLAMLQIGSFSDTWPMQLSGGQRQRVAIARALAIEPEFMLMDEPYSTLDEVTARTLRTELLDVWQATKKTVVFVTHSIREAVFLGDRVVVLTRGPGSVLDIVDVAIPRPRDYEDVELTKIEQHIISLAMANWHLLSPEEP